jgi:hypothetical protein
MPKISINERANGFSHALVFDYVDLQTTGFLSTIGAANQRAVGSQGPGDIIKDAALIQIVDPAGATDLTIDFGTTSSDPDEYLDNGDVDGATQLIYNTGDAFIGTDSGSATTSNVINGVSNNTTSAKPLIMEFNGTVASLTAGKWVLAWNQLNAYSLAQAYGAGGM